jgi:hypothetical protein
VLSKDFFQPLLRFNFLLYSVLVADGNWKHNIALLKGCHKIGIHSGTTKAKVTTQHLKKSITKTNIMTVSIGMFSLSALLTSKSIDTTQIDLIDDNAKLPSKELLVQVGLLEHSISSFQQSTRMKASTQSIILSWSKVYHSTKQGVGGVARWEEEKPSKRIKRPLEEDVDLLADPLSKGSLKCDEALGLCKNRLFN